MSELPLINKTLEYRRARFNTPGYNLEELTRQAWGRFGTQLERAVTRSDGVSTSGIRGRDEGSWGFSVHCARYYDRQGVGTIPMAPAEQVELGERRPEANENFLNSDFFALIRGNDLVCLNCGRNAGALRSYLSLLFVQARLQNEAQFFELARVGNPNTLAIIERIGVRSIDMKVEIAEATAIDLVQGDGTSGAWWNAKRQISEAFKGLTAGDDDLRQLRLAEKGSITVSINVKKGDLGVAKEGLDNLASDIAEDDEADGYVIKLRNNTTITPDAVSVKKPVRLETNANSVNVNEAWDAMRTYMEELEQIGQLRA